MRRTLFTVVATTSLGAGLLLSATAANATVLLRTTNPTNGCTTTYYGPDVAIKTLPTPGVKTTGGFGESVSCP
ncbi:MAG: hypothetical protein JWP11_794 [Frankiales bacterium]|jgi:uncharacterized protein YgiB involved in biofilm formation|nr:hypothetical protein [Frankiales bacterium]